MNDGSISIDDMTKKYGLRVSGLCMFVQIAEQLEIGPVTIDGDARIMTLKWLHEWNEELKK